MRTTFQRGQNVGFGDLRLRALDEHITSMHECFRRRCVDRAADSRGYQVRRRCYGIGWVLGTISATGCGWAQRPAKGHENRRVCRMAVLGAARSRLAMEPARPSNCLIRSVR